MQFVIVLLLASFGLKNSKEVKQAVFLLLVPFVFHSSFVTTNGQEQPPIMDGAAELALLEAVRGPMGPNSMGFPNEGQTWVPSSQHAELLPAKKEKQLRKKLQKDLAKMNKEIAHFYKKREKEFHNAQTDADATATAIKEELKRQTPGDTLTIPYYMYRDHLVEVLLDKSPDVPLLYETQEPNPKKHNQQIPYSKKLKKSQTYVNLVSRYSPYVLGPTPGEPDNTEDSCTWVYNDSGGIECLLNGETLPVRKTQKDILIDPTINVAVDLSSRGFHNVEDALLDHGDDCVDIYKDKRSGVILCVPAGSKASHYRKQDRYQHGGVRPKYWTSANKVYWKEYSTRMKSPIPADHIATTFVNPQNLGQPQLVHYETSKKVPQQGEWHYANQRIPVVGPILAEETVEPKGIQGATDAPLPPSSSSTPMEVEVNIE